MSVTETGVTYQELLNKNRKYLWNPFTQMKEYLQNQPVIVERGHGLKLVDVDGKEYWDGNASVWLNPLGHNRRELNEAIIKQLDKVAHSTLLGCSNVPAILLAEKLVEITPARLRKVFYSDSGAEAVEIALKIACLYWKHRGRPEKQTFLSMRNAYHGDTVGAVSVGGIDLFHAAYGPMLFSTEKVSYPYPYRFEGTEEECKRACLEELEQRLEEKRDEIAGVVVEPMVQGAGGLIRMPEGYLKEVERLCRQHDVLLIADEVATGFGRTGRMFACDHEQVEPDLMTLGKKLTGGYLPVAATLTSNEVYDAFYADHREAKTFFHGHSYTGNQLGCAVALETLAIYEREGIVEHVRKTAPVLKEMLRPLSELAHVGEVRQLGFMVGIELVQDKASKTLYPWEDAMGEKVCHRARELGMITRPLGHVITFMPPLIAGQEELQAMVDILIRSVREVTEE